MKEKLLLMEEIHDLGVNGLTLMQNKDKYCFTSDAVLLADFINIKNKDVFCDIGTGSGIIPILICGKTKKIKKAYAIEIQSYMADLTKRNVSLNKMEDIVEVVNDDIKNCYQLLYQKNVTVISCNPPYRKIGAGEKNLVDEIAISRHEVCLKLEELIFCVGKILSTAGRFYMCHQADRIAEIIECLYKNKLTPKTMRFVSSKPQAKPYLVLIEAIKNGGHGVDVLNELVVCDINGELTQEIVDIYSKSEK